LAAISNLTVYANLQVLSRLGDGDKLNIDHQTGALTKHVPHRGEMLTRWYFGAFNTETVQQTFSRAFELIELEDRESDNVKTYGHLSELIPSALTGVQTLKATYDVENKAEVSGQLDRIYEQFEKQFGQIKKEAPVKNAPPSAVAVPVEDHDADDRPSRIDEAAVVLDEDVSTDDGEPSVPDERPLIRIAEKVQKVSRWKKIFCCIK